MNDMITLRGWVGTEPTKGLTVYNAAYTRFRMSVSERRFDRDRQSWVDSHTSWYSVVCYGTIAENVAASVHKGQRLIVMGRLRLKSYSRADGTAAMEADFVAASVGHDLALGMATWNRRRDEGSVTPFPAFPAHVDGVGPVNPVTGEVAANAGPEDPFGPDEPPFEDDQDFGVMGPLGTAADGHEPHAGGEEDLGPEQRLLSA